MDHGHIFDLSTIVYSKCDSYCLGCKKMHQNDLTFINQETVRIKCPNMFAMRGFLT